MSSPITVLGMTTLWPTTGDTGYSNAAYQTIFNLSQAVLPIEGLYNPNAPGGVGNIGIDDDGNLTLNGSTIGLGTVSSVSISSAADLTVSGSPITTTGTINLDLSATGVSPGSYTLANITVDAKGRITSATSGTPPPGGTVTSVASTGTQGVITSVLTPTSTPNVQIGLGNITPLTANLTGGTLTFSGTTNRITGNFTTLTSRLQFQTSVSNGATSVEMLPNGTSRNSTLNLNNTSDVNNTGLLSIGTSSTNHFISAALRGTGSNLPIIMSSGGVTGIRIETSGNVTIPTTLAVTGTVTASNISGTNTGDQTITATGDATGISTGSPATSLPLTLANTTVVPGTYPFATIEVDSKGRITAASSGTPTTAVWGNITGDINNQTDLKNIFTVIGTSVLSTGVTTTTDTIGLVALNDTTVRLNAVTQAIFFSLIPTGIPNALRTFAQQDYPLASIGLAVDGIYVRFIGVNQAGTVVISTTTFALDENVLQFGYMILKRVAGVTTFLDGAIGPRNVFTWPSFAGNNAALDEFLIPETNVTITPNVNLTVKNNSGVIKGLGINWGTANVNERPKTSSNPMSFVTVNPSTALAVVLPPAGTAVQVTQYWNGTAMTTLSGPNTASVQRFLMTVTGGVFQQVGEQEFTNLADAVDAISIAPFAAFLPTDSYIEICRFASRRAATNLSNNADAVFSYGGGVGGGGTSAGTVTSVAIAGTQGVSSTGGPITTNGTITVGLGAITPTSVTATGTVTGSNLSGTNTGNQVIVLTGDATNANTSTGGALTLATVNSNVGSFTNANLTVNAKGLVTAAANGTIPATTWGTITGTLSAQTDLQTALNAKVSKTGDTITGELNISNTDSVPDVSSIIMAKPDATTNPELQLFGGDWNTDFDDSFTSTGVRLGGSYLALESPDISMQLNSAQVGSRVIVVGLTERGNSILGVEPPPVPSYSVQTGSTTNTLIYDTGPIPSPWVPISGTLTTTQIIDANSAIIYFEVVVENIGNNKTGTVEIGIGIDGLTPLAINTVAYPMGAFVKQLFANSAINAISYPIGTTAQLWARAITGSSSGFDIFARNAERPSLLKIVVLGEGGAITPPAGANTEIQFNNSGVFGASSNLTYDGTTVNINGNLNFTGTANKIQGDFTNATAANRTVFQSNVTNGQTAVILRPNGTATSGSLGIDSNSSGVNCPTVFLYNNNVTTGINSSVRGAGTYLPLQFYSGSGALAGVTQDIQGNVVIGGNTALATNATDRFLYLNAMAGTPTGTPSTPVGTAAMLGKSAITVDTTSNKLHFYSSGAWREAGGGGGVTQIIAGTNVTISPPGGTGAVTINATGGGGGSSDPIPTVFMLMGA